MNKKQEFLKHVEPLSGEDAKWINALADERKFDYYDLTQSKAHNSPLSECKDAAISFNEFLGGLYTEWYDKFSSQKFGLCAKMRYKKFLNDNRFNPHAAEHKLFLEKNTYSKYQEILNQIHDIYPAVYYSNINSFPYLDQNLTFVHFVVNKKDIKQYKTECRLYLNVKSKNVLSKSLKSDNAPKDNEAGIAIAEVKKNTSTAAFFLVILKYSL